MASKKQKHTTLIIIIYGGGEFDYEKAHLPISGEKMTREGRLREKVGSRSRTGLVIHWTSTIAWARKGISILLTYKAGRRRKKIAMSGPSKSKGTFFKTQRPSTLSSLNELGTGKRKTTSGQTLKDDTPPPKGQLYLRGYISSAQALIKELGKNREKIARSMPASL